MSPSPYCLPSFTALIAFEAAARLLSFKLAAEELNVTAGAVSHQIKALEQDIGLKVFHRRHRGVELTETGEELHRVMSSSLFEISQILSALRDQRGHSGVLVGATTAMSSLWLTPTISRFWRMRSDLGINQVVSDSMHFGQSVPDLVISYGPYERTGYSGEPLFRDVLLPVCSPNFANNIRTDSLAALAMGPLIHIDATDNRWTSWKSWFGELGYDGGVSRGVTFNNYMIALQAAQDDVGLVLGWRKLVAPLLDSGALICLEAFSIPAPTSFFLSRNRSTLNDTELDELERWIITSARTSEKISS